jgi:nickel-type superoxide dismutase maturation protease
MIIVRRIIGDSMTPGLPAGTLIVAVSWPRSFKAGHIVIIRHNGLEKIKRITQIQGDQVYVTGDNPDASTDSRHFGWLPVSTIMARVVWPR